MNTTFCISAARALQARTHTNTFFK